MRKKKKKQIVELCSDAQRLFIDQNYEKAITKWKEVLGLDPENRIVNDGIKEAVIKKTAS